ncbi:MAG: ABC transporter ATP-binding protein [Chitinophagales bacterium]|nr:ABC transporter ATP-binding protein [Bacteroidota bacterium]MCB9042957.1 ABC transporter ATP-binding protein [Chitinophagales bacterium]
MKLSTIFQSFDWTLFRRVLRLLQPYKKWFAATSSLAIALAILSPLRPYLVQKTVDNNIITPDLAGLQTMAILLLIVLILETLCEYLFIYSSNWLGQSVVKDLRIRMYKHIINLRLRYFDTTPIGTSTTRTINDVEAINDIFSAGLIDIIADVLSILVVLGFMFYTDWRLALVCLASLPFFIYCTYLFKEGIKKSFTEVRTQVARMNAFLQEHISGMSIVQIFAAEEREKNRFAAINKAQTDANIKSIWYYSVFFPVVEIILASALGTMVWYGANQVLGGTTTLGTLIAFILYLNMVFRPLRMLADRFNTLQMGMVAAERVFALLDRHEFIDDKGTLSPKSVKGNIRFEKVWFAYNEVDWVLKGISFHLEAGKTLAIVGATGAGKSSIINILNRFYEIQQGTISIDDVNIKDYTLNSLRANIGLVLQDVFLFSGSIYDNISLRNPNISREAVQQAAKMVGADTFIEKLPNSYDYQVMERGATLSMGQRQLISFIRALVYNPSILILDEATASIDTETEQLIQEATEKMVENRTAIIIAHRLSTIRNADYIMVMDKGEIVEMGNHESLIQEANGFYRKLYEMQFGKIEIV